jgi:FkbM family methyltransferase
MERPRSPKRLYDLVLITNGTWYRVVLVCVYVYLSLLRRLGKKPVLKGDGVYLEFSYKDSKVGYFVETQLDFDVFWDSLVEDQYTLGPEVSSSSVKTIFDLGSNIGTTVVAFYHKYPNATIYACEPDPHNFNRLKRHVALLKEGSTRVKLFNVAITDTDGGVIPFFIGTKDHWSSSILKRSVTNNEVSITTRSLDGLCTTEAIEHIDIMKMDIEGAEDLALDGFTQLQKVKWFLGEMHPTLMRSSIKDFIYRFIGFELRSLNTATGVFTCVRMDDILHTRDRDQYSA